MTITTLGEIANLAEYGLKMQFGSFTRSSTESLANKLWHEYSV